MLAISSLSCANAQPQPGSAPQWQIYASCSAAYHANWQLRQSTRSQDMSSMIQEQFEDYKAKAIGQAGTLEAYIDQCPAN